MKRIILLTTGALCVAVAAITMTGCSNHTEPGRIYMPDMAYSRAVETYVGLDTTLFTTQAAKRGNFIFYNASPVPGTIRRGDLPDYTLADDSSGYALSAQLRNPLPPLNGKDSAEAARLFNIYCAICHGEGGAANGPLATSGKVGGVANLTADAYIKMADGTMYHSLYYGKNNMGSYASQLDKKQRWQLVQYIRTLQPRPAAAVAPAPSTKDSTGTSRRS